MMSAEIVDFTTRHRTPSYDDTPRQSATAKNQHLRSARWKVWRKADATTSYWRALLDLADA
jgi:hypothetical protein